MSAHWLKIESCRAGFKSDEKVSCSVFYPWKNALFSEGTMNAETQRVWREVKVINTPIPLEQECVKNMQGT